jgi:hypothetical protein
MKNPLTPVRTQLGSNRCNLTDRGVSKSSVVAGQGGGPPGDRTQNPRIKSRLSAAASGVPPHPGMSSCAWPSSRRATGCFLVPVDRVSIERSPNPSQRGRPVGTSGQEANQQCGRVGVRWGPIGPRAVLGPAQQRRLPSRLQRRRESTRASHSRDLQPHQILDAYGAESRRRGRTAQCEVIAIAVLRQRSMAPQILHRARRQLTDPREQRCLRREQGRSRLTWRDGQTHAG